MYILVHVNLTNNECFLTNVNLSYKSIRVKYCFVVLEKSFHKLPPTYFVLFCTLIFPLVNLFEIRVLLELIFVSEIFAQIGQVCFW